MRRVLRAAAAAAVVKPAQAEAAYPGKATMVAAGPLGIPAAAALAALVLPQLLRRLAATAAVVLPTALQVLVSLGLVVEVEADRQRKGRVALAAAAMRLVRAPEVRALLIPAAVVVVNTTQATVALAAPASSSSRFAPRNPINF
jgi:hypothetical protein